MTTGLAHICATEIRLLTTDGGIDAVADTDVGIKIKTETISCFYTSGAAEAVKGVDEKDGMGSATRTNVSADRLGGETFATIIESADTELVVYAGLKDYERAAIAMGEGALVPVILALTDIEDVVSGSGRRFERI